MVCILVHMSTEINRDGRIARCFKCKSTYRYSWGREQAQSLDCCGVRLQYKTIVGVTSDKKCDSRCTNAVSAACECSCGGQNHGDRWGAHAQAS